MKTVVFEGVYETRGKQTREYDWQDDDQLADVSICFVKIDGKVYRFEEDPSDGYRSYCRETIIDYTPPGHFNFQDFPVLVCMQEVRGTDVGNPDDNYGPYDMRNFNGIIIYSPRDKTTVLGCFGTDNSDDYYPSCRMYMDIVAINEHCIPNTEAGKLIYAPEE